MEDLKKILKELESIEDSLRGGDSDTASIDLHFLIVELLDKINNDAQYISKVNREQDKGQVWYLYSFNMRGCINPLDFSMITLLAIFVLFCWVMGIYYIVIGDQSSETR